MVGAVLAPVLCLGTSEDSEDDRVLRLNVEAIVTVILA